jgi:predicted ABC-type ATPase
MVNHELSQGQLREIFDQDILPDLHTNYGPFEKVEHPHFVILGGQPGSGKSGLQKEAYAELHQRGSTIIVEGDAYRKHHPQFNEFAASNDPLEMPHKTAQAAGAWVKMLMEFGVENRLNIVLESTMRQPEVVKNTVRSLSAHGYHTEAHVIAVKRELSEAGVYSRYEDLINQIGVTRYSPTEAHDAAYRGFPQSLDALQKDGIIEKIKIYNREGPVATILANGEMIRPGEDRQLVLPLGIGPSASEVINAERYAPFSSAQLVDLHLIWSSISKSKETRNAPASELEKMAAKKASAYRRLMLDPEAREIHARQLGFPLDLTPSQTFKLLDEELTYTRALVHERGVATPEEAKAIIETLVPNHHAREQDIERFLSIPSVPTEQITQRFERGISIS